jgi:arylamine N-acetyltransferase
MTHENTYRDDNIRLYDKDSESDFCFFHPPKSEYFFQQHWESEYFFRKKPYPPPPFQVKWSFLNSLMMCALRRSNYTSVLVFVLTQPDLKLTIYPTWDEHTNQYTTDAVVKID